MRLSDRNDPLFLWQSSLTEEEFYVLRREQNLLVDFHRFPHKLVELLQQCIAHAREEHPVFAATLQITPEETIAGRPASALLTITESTSFRQIVHLSLRLQPLSEQQMKRHLADVVQRYKEEMEALRGRTHQLPMEYPPRNVPIPPQYSGPACDERVLSIDSELRALETQNQLLISQKMALENEVVDLRRRLGLGVPVGYEQPPPPLGVPLPTPPPGSQYTMQHDIHKANEIIRKLQDEAKSLRSRSRTAEASVRQLEKLLKEAQASSETIRSEATSLRQQLAERTASLASTQAERERAQTELEETKKLVEANEKVIEWLHQQINEDSLNRMYTKHGAAPPLPRRFSPDILATGGTTKIPFSMGRDRNSSSSSSPPNFEI